MTKQPPREAYEGGWFHSGLRIMVDRYKAGGENVSSIRVESALAQHPGGNEFHEGTRAFLERRPPRFRPE